MHPMLEDVRYLISYLVVMAYKSRAARSCEAHDEITADCA